MDTQRKNLKCPVKEPHKAHNWTFKWDRPETDYQCPGVEDEERKA